MRPYFCQKVLLCYAEHYPYRWVACCDLALRGYISVQKGEESRKKEWKEQRFHYRLVRMCMPDHAGPFLGKKSARATDNNACIHREKATANDMASTTMRNAIPGGCPQNKK